MQRLENKKFQNLEKSTKDTGYEETKCFKQRGHREFRFLNFIF